MDISSRLKQIKIENFIFIIYFGIILLSLYTNKIEKKYLIYRDENDKVKYRRLLILIFVIAVIVYAYYFYDSYKSVNEVSQNSEVNRFNRLSFIASTLVLISGLIFLYIAYSDKDLNVELAFS